MNPILRNHSLRQTTCLWISKRHAMKKSKIIEEQSTIDDLPVFQYPQPSPQDRRVYAWGLRETGALGMVTKNKIKRMSFMKEGWYVNRPIRLDFPEYYAVTAVACGFGFTAFAVKSKDHNKVFGTGLNTDSQIGYQARRKDHPLELLKCPVPVGIRFKRPKSTQITGIAAGRAHLVVLTDSEGIFLLGNNAYGQCARRIIEGENYFGSEIINHLENVDGAAVRSIACGQDHTLFITEKGKVYACGWGADGQTGQGHYENTSTPSPVQGDIEGENIIKVASAMDCILAINDKGDVFGWGNAEYGQIPVEETEKALQYPFARELKCCRPLGKIVDVAAGGTFCMVLNDEGQVFVWGYGILGLGPKVEHKYQPTEIPATLFGKNDLQPESKVVGITCGMSHLLAWNNYGDLFSWGKNKSGCLGLGIQTDQFFPFRVALGSSVVSAHCGVDHTMAYCRAT